jgi:hypothetical protein
VCQAELYSFNKPIAMPPKIESIFDALPSP